MFTRTYGILYQQNAQVFSELFHDLRTYFRGTQLNLDRVLGGFFSSLLLRMFTLLNGQYVFDERYLGCIADRSSELTPFGDVPQKLSVQVKRALIAARTFYQGLSVGADVISSLGRVCTLVHVFFILDNLRYNAMSCEQVSSKSCDAVGWLSGRASIEPANI